MKNLIRYLAVLGTLALSTPALAIDGFTGRDRHAAPIAAPRDDGDNIDENTPPPEDDGVTDPVDDPAPEENPPPE